MHVDASQRRLRSEARMNVYAWSYAKLWCTALQATAGGVRHARHSNSSPRANKRAPLGSCSRGASVRPKGTYVRSEHLG
jgi:hypothetical protein